MPSWFWKLLLVFAAAVWGGSFVVLKDSLDAMSPSWLLFVRFSLSSLLMVAIFWRRLRERLSWPLIGRGAVLGVLYGAAYVFQTYGLASTTPGRNGFITALYCVMTPFLAWAFMGRRPGRNNVLAAVLAVVGLGFLSLGDDLSLSLSVGDWLTVACAVLFALHIVAATQFSGSHDVICLTVVQMVVTALVALMVAVPLETPPAPDVLTPRFAAGLLYLVLLASVCCTIAQNVGQAHTEPAESSLCLSLEGVFAVVFSVIFYGEVITLQLAVGFALIFVAILVSELGGACGNGSEPFPPDA